MSEYVEHVTEVLEQFGAIRVRRMFGGYGVYHNGRMFGLIADDVLYLKADDESIKSFKDKGLAQFEYVKNGKPTKMSYFMAPEEIFDDADEANAWASLAYDAALRSRSRAGKAKKKKR
jgi:DNA transformation protein